MGVAVWTTRHGWVGGVLLNFPAPTAEPHRSANVSDETSVGLFLWPDHKGDGMSGEIEIVSDGEGLAVLGDPAHIDPFFSVAGIDSSSSEELDLNRLASITSAGSAATQIGANYLENAGRWVKLTKESADAIKKVGLTPTKTPGVNYAMIGAPGDIKQWILLSQAPSALLTGPFALTALSTMMQQHAMQQQMDQIVEYLQEINEKVDDILRNQKDAIFSQIIGVDLMLNETITVREQVGGVSAVTWSKIQGSGETIAITQSYALLQLDNITQKLDGKADVGDIAKATKEAEPKIREWLAVLAKTFQLQAAYGILELDRVGEANPEELERHRRGITIARQKRIELVGRNTFRILAQMEATARLANAKVLLNPFDSPAAVQSSKKVTGAVLEFRNRLGIESEHQPVDARRWRDAAEDVRDKAISATTGAFNHATDVFKPKDTDGDGVPDKPRVVVAAEDAGGALKDAGSAVKDAATGIADKFSGILKRKPRNEDRDETPSDPTGSKES